MTLTHTVAGEKGDYRPRPSGNGLCKGKLVGPRAKREENASRFILGVMSSRQAGNTGRMSGRCG